jgi:hypothetical protein
MLGKSIIHLMHMELLLCAGTVLKNIPMFLGFILPRTFEVGVILILLYSCGK